MTAFAASQSWRPVGRPGPVLPDRAGRRATFEAARRHSRFVRRMRVVLPVAGATALLAFIVVTRISLPGNLDLSMAKLSVTRNSIIMDSPHLTGFDESHREYTVSADRAVQPLAAPDQVKLEAIKAVVKPSGQGTATVTADNGDYDNRAGTLKLFGGIAVDSSEGYTLHLDGADIDLHAGTMSSSNPVAASYHDSNTTAGRLSVTGGGHTVVLEGSVRTTLMPPKRAAADAVQAPKE